MKNRKKALIATLVTIAVLAAVAAGVWFFWLRDYLSVSGASPVYVNPVSAIIGMDTGANPRYSGIVEPQETYWIRKDDSKTVSEILVRVGDEIHVGDLLFRYDNEALALELTQAEIDLEGIADQIATYNRQLTDLRDKLSKAAKDDQYAYTVQINALEVQIKRQQFESDKKRAEVDRLREDLTKTEVYSEVDGVVKEIVTGTDGSYTGNANGFISVLSSGDYRVKGTVSELNVSSLSVGQAVLVHSRLDGTVWSGTVTSIDQEAAKDQNNNGYYYGIDSGERSSKYNFFVSLNSPEGLILGQHVYIEPDTGAAAPREGLWLPAMYVGHDEEGSFVWARGKDDKLEKRLVLLGDYDSEADLYEIKDGVARTDYITFPTEELKAGMPTTEGSGDPVVLLPSGDGLESPENGGFLETVPLPEADPFPAGDGSVDTADAYQGWEDAESGGGEGTLP